MKYTIKNYYRIVWFILLAPIFSCCSESEGSEEVLDENLKLEIPNYASDKFTVSSIAELRQAARLSGKDITMTPGEYTVTSTMSYDVKTIFDFCGSNNTYHLEGVTIYVPTEVLRDMGPGETHEFATYRITGDNLTFDGGHFESTGEEHPYKSIAEFKIQGNNVSFLNCTIIIRGSAPYGYGDYYGKGSPSYVTLYKHSAMSILGDDILVDACNFEVYSFGHGIHIHGAQNTILRDINMVGAVRLTDEIYTETSGPAYDYGFKIYFPDWEQGNDIPLGEMKHLTEDGIRAYLDGDDKDGNSRRTGDITVENCVVDKMRGGITLCIGSGTMTVTDCVVTNCEHGYSMPSNAVVRNCKGNAAFGPLLMLPYSHKGNADIELELLYPETEMGSHSLAEITGTGHKITISYNDSRTLPTARAIMVGSTGTRYTSENSEEEELFSDNKANSIVVNNLTSNTVELTEYSTLCTVTSNGEVSDVGVDNTIN